MTDRQPYFDSPIPRLFNFLCISPIFKIADKYLLKYQAKKNLPFFIPHTSATGINKICITYYNKITVILQ